MAEPMAKLTSAPTPSNFPKVESPNPSHSIRLHDRLLIILSEYSINSNWVKKEVETGFEEESRRNQTILFPIRLDETVMHTDQAWAADIRRTKYIYPKRRHERGFFDSTLVND